MASVLRLAGTGADDASIGTVIWSAPTRIAVSDDSRTTAALVAGINQTSHYLVSSSHGFVVGDVPLTATIMGLEALIEGRVTVANTIVEYDIRFVKGGVIGGNNFAYNRYLPVNEAVQAVGGYGFLGGQTWAPADIHAAGFGVAYAVRNIHASSNATAQIDAISIRVYYKIGERQIVRRTPFVLGAWRRPWNDPGLLKF